MQIEYNEKSQHRELLHLQDQITILRKICIQREFKEIKKPIYLISFYGNSETDRDKVMDKTREELRQDGYSFCHRRENGDEIWAKY